MSLKQKSRIHKVQARTGSDTKVKYSRRCRYRHVIAEGEFRCPYRHPLELEGDLKAVYLDIEATNLDADFGRVLSYALKPQGQSHVTAAVIDGKKHALEAEKELLEQFMKDIQPYNVWITYYGTGFDIMYLRARCMYHGIDFPAYGSARHVDLYYVARGRMKLSSRRLQRVAEFLGIEGKTPLRGDIWVNAGLGDEVALGYILAHNIEDVRVLEQVHGRLERYMASPNRKSI